MDYKESWVPKNWCFWTLVSEKTLEILLDWKVIKPVNPKGNFLNTHWKDWCWRWSSNVWPRDAKNWLTGKDLNAGKYWRQEEKGMTEDEMVGWHHRLDGLLWASCGSWKWTGKPGMLHSLGSQKPQTGLSDWTEL